MSAMDICHETAEAKHVAWEELLGTYRSTSDLLKAAREGLLSGFDDLSKKREELLKENGGSEVADADRIEINAGGKVVVATRGTLTQMKGTRLEALFSGRWEKKLLRDGEGRVFLDVNPKCFRTIVDYLNELKISAPNSLMDAPSVDEDNKVFLETLMKHLGLTGNGNGASAGTERPKDTTGPDLFPEQWQTIKFDKFPKKLRAAFEKEQAALISAKIELAEETRQLEQERNLVEHFSRGESKDIVWLNVSGVPMASMRSTLGLCEDSVLAKQFNDPKWKQKADANTPPAGDWSCEQVAEWLKETEGVPEEVAETLLKEKTTGRELLALGRDDLKDMGISRAGTLALVMQAIKGLKSDCKKNSEVLVEQSSYCFGKIIDQLRLRAMYKSNEPILLPPPPHIRSGEKRRFEKVVEYYFPGDMASYILGPSVPPGTSPARDGGDGDGGAPSGSKRSAAPSSSGFSFGSAGNPPPPLFSFSAVPTRNASRTTSRTPQVSQGGFSFGPALSQSSTRRGGTFGSSG